MYIRPVVPGSAEDAMSPQILADQLTLSEPRGADYAHRMILAPPDFQTFRRPYIWTDVQPILNRSVVPVIKALLHISSSFADISVKIWGKGLQPSSDGPATIFMSRNNDWELSKSYKCWSVFRASLNLKKTIFRLQAASNKRFFKLCCTLYTRPNVHPDCNCFLLHCTYM